MAHWVSVIKHANSGGKLTIDDHIAPVKALMTDFIETLAMHPYVQERKESHNQMTKLASLFTTGGYTTSWIPALAIRDIDISSGLSAKNLKKFEKDVIAAYSAKSNTLVGPITYRKK